MNRLHHPVWVVALVLAVSAPMAWAIVRPPAKSKRARASLHVRGSLHAPLRPGTGQRLDLTLINRRDVPLLVTRLVVRARLDARHRAAGCTRRDFAIRPISRRVFPIRVGVLGMVRLGALSPHVRMKNLPRNQDACQGTRLHLRYVAKVRRAR